jgi:soluble lytic murein transglycosylase
MSKTLGKQSARRLPPWERRQVKLKQYAIVGLGAAAALGFIIGIGRALSGLARNPVEEAKVVQLAANLDIVPENSTQLQQIAKNGGMAAARARYVLAAKAIDRQQPEEALKLLDGLERDYDLLAPYILYQRAHAYTMAQNADRAKATWRDLLSRYPDAAVSVEAIPHVAADDRNAVDRAIEKFPYYPRTIELIQRRWKVNPTRHNLLLILARSPFVNFDSIRPGLDRLLADPPTQLTPADWETIADLYWEHRHYGQAAIAIQQQPPQPQRAYLIGRALQYSNQNSLAQAKYLTTAEKYPNTPAAQRAYLRLGELAGTPAEKADFFTRARGNDAEISAEAMRQQISLKLPADPAGAEALRLQLIKEYPQTEAAATLRWQAARQAASKNDFATAAELAAKIVTQSPKTKFAPRAAFWWGKWATKQNQPDVAKKAFETAIANYSRSYYSWRSAQMLGWNVGTPDTVMSTQPPVAISQPPQPLSVGSPVLQELYQLQQGKEAWYLWQTERPRSANQTNDRGAPVSQVPNLFIEALLQGKSGDQRGSIQQLFAMEDLTESHDQTALEALENSLQYRQALYPLPYWETIAKWGNTRQVNPLLIISIIRQESKFDPTIRSIAGAVGLMQIIPPTAAVVARNINVTNYNMEVPEDNVSFGSWYIKYTHQNVRNNSILAIAGYNSGPGNVAKWKQQFGTTDLDDFVEKIPFPETESYVKNVLGNYWNYLQIYSPEIVAKIEELQARHKGSN